MAPGPVKRNRRRHDVARNGRPPRHLEGKPPAAGRPTGGVENRGRPPADGAAGPRNPLRPIDDMQSFAD